MLILPLESACLPPKNFAVYTNNTLKEYRGQRAVFLDQSFCDWSLNLVSCSKQSGYDMYLTHIDNNQSIYFLLENPSSVSIELPQSTAHFSVVLERWEGRQIEVLGKRFGYSMSNFAIDYSSNNLRISPSPYPPRKHLAAHFISNGIQQQVVTIRVPYNVRISGVYEPLESKKAFPLFTKLYENFVYGTV